MYVLQVERNLTGQVPFAIPSDDFLSHIVELDVLNVAGIFVVFDGLVHLFVGSHPVFEVLHQQAAAEDRAAVQAGG